MADIPPCANSVKGNCRNYEVKLVNETDEGWVFQCQNPLCKCLQVVSKDGVRERSKYENARKRQEEEVRRQKLISSRRKIFA